MYGDLLAHAQRALRPDLPIVELGGAPGFVKEIDPDVIVTDVVPGIGVDLVAPAEALPFPDESVRAIIVKDVLHHMRDVPAFLNEAKRTLTPGGRIVALEPYWGLLARTVYTHAHPEPFEPDASEWGVHGDDRWHSNQALAYILLRRDRAAFESSIPDFAIREIGYRTGLSYLFSGGLYSRTPIPARPLVWMLRAEHAMARWLRPVALHILFTLQKSDHSKMAH